MKRLLHCLTRPSRSFFGFYLLALTASAQVGPPDSTVVSGSSTVLKIRPMAFVYAGLNLAVEQTLGKRSSVQLDVYETIGNGLFVRVLGRGRSLSGSFHYYPLAKQTAPNGLYVGSKLSYSRVSTSSLVRLITFFDGTGDVALWSAQASVGYQYVSRRNIVLDAQVGMGFLHNLTYYRGGLSGQPATERRTRFAPTIPSLAVSVGYRFRHRRNW